MEYFERNAGELPVRETDRDPVWLPISSRGRGGWLGFLAIFIVCADLAGDPTNGPASLETLREQFLAHATRPRFARAHWGIHVVSLDTGCTLFTANADKLFIPASTTKLFTGALALDQLGPDFRIRTSWYAASRPDDRGTIQGDLLLYGRGDPSLDLRAAGGDWDRGLAPLVEALASTGARVVTGNLIADESFFRGPAIGSGWEHDDLQWYYGAEVSALSVNNNSVDVVVRPAARAGLPAQVLLFPSTSYLVVSNLTQTASVGTKRRIEVSRAMDANVMLAKGKVPLEAPPLTESVSVRRPAGWLASEIRQALERRGIRIRGKVAVVNASARDRAPQDLDGMIELGAVWSPPLSELLPRMMKPSQNLHAQLLLLQVGAAQPRDPETDQTTEQAGLVAMAGFLAKSGLASGEARFEEGSGLSRHNLVTPRALVELLRFMLRHPHAKVFLDALPVAGLDGTLRSRMRGTLAERNLRAKTGSLSMVSALAGYVTTAAGEPLVFALLLNNHVGAADERPGRAELDELAVKLAGLRQHTRETAGE